MANSYLKRWWKWLKYDPSDPRFSSGATIKIVTIGGGTAMPMLLRGLRSYSSHITAIAAVSDSGGSAGRTRDEFDMLSPGDVRRCISALSNDEKLITELFNFRFQGKNSFTGHTLGNIWLAALTEHFGSFEKAVEVTSQIFQTAGIVIPATLDKVDLKIEYEDNSVKIGENYLDEILTKVKKISFKEKRVRGYEKAVKAISDADMIVVGPGSLYGSLICNLLIKEIKEAIVDNKKAMKIFIVNCSTERTQTRNYTVEDHLEAVKDHVGVELFDYCLVNNQILRLSSDQSKLGEVNNITTDKKVIDGVEVVLADTVSKENPLYHDSKKLAKAIMELYNENKHRNTKNTEIRN